MARHLSEIHVTKIDLVGRPAIKRGATLFKSSQREETVETKDLIKAIAEMTDEDRKVAGLSPVEKTDDEATKAAKLAKEKTDKAEAEKKAVDAEDKLLVKFLKRMGMKKDAVADPLDEVPEEVKKAIVTMQGQVEKADERVTKAEERAEKADKAIAKMADARRSEEFIRKAAKFSNLPGAAPDDFGPILKAIDGVLTKEQATKFEQVLAGAHETIGKMDLYSEIGSTVEGAEAHGAVQALVEKAMAADPKLTKEAAAARVYKTRPDLYDEVVKAEDDRKRGRA